MLLIYYAGLVGLLPTISMLFTAIFGSTWELNNVIEANAQNYCAGLILGAVSMELFPIINHLDWHVSLPGITSGFIFALAFVSSLDFIVNSIEDSYQSHESPSIFDFFVSFTKGDKNQEKSSNANGGNSYYQALSQAENGDSGLELRTKSLDKQSSGASKEGASDEESSIASSLGDVPLMQLAFQATRSPFHRDQIRNKVQEILEFIKNIQDKSKKMLTSQQMLITAKESKGLQRKISHSEPHSSSNNAVVGTARQRRPSQDETNNATKMIEIFADEIDQDIHQLQYILDHCRRILQGAGSDIDGVIPRIFIDEDGGQKLTTTLTRLNKCVESINEILCEDPLSKHAIKEVHRLMDHMDKQIDELHETVEDYNFKWKKRTKITNRAPIPQTGSFVPLGFLIPVIVDSVVDGFFMGTTCAISERAGMILAVSNCLEMGFLGLAVSIRVNKCTGSSAVMRMFSLIFPPIIMLAAAIFGAFVGDTLKTYPTMFVGFISFGIVALLSLAINELLVEARKSQEENERWWSGMVVFVGIYSVILMDMLPSVDAA